MHKERLKRIMKKNVVETKKRQSINLNKKQPAKLLTGAEFFEDAERYARNCETNIFIAELKNQYCC